MQIEAVIKFKLGSDPTLGDLRNLVSKTLKMGENTRLGFKIDRGQRDEESVTVLVQAASLLD